MINQEIKKDKVVAYALQMFQDKVESKGWNISIVDEKSFIEKADYRIVLGLDG